MVVPKGNHNAYEELPDLVKELVTSGADEKGKRPKSKVSRDTLLRTHQKHLKLLSEGSVPVRNLILPLPYPPSRASVHNTATKLVHISDLLIETRDSGAVLLLRAVTTPYVWSSTVTVAEDETGDVVRLTVCNLEDNVIDPIVIQGSLLAIKQPCWSQLVDGGYHVRVDHPSDMVILKPEDDIVPETWRENNSSASKTPSQWKKEGDMMFLKKKFRQALEHYDKGLACLSSSPDPAVEIDFHRKRCGVNIVLLRLDDAAKDLASAISVHARSTPNLSSSKLIDFDTVQLWLHSRSTDDPYQISSNIPRALKELAARIKFDIGLNQSTPEYDLSTISSYVGPLTLHVDAANYLCDTEVRGTTSHGRGLFAKRAFKEGDLVCAEKAFVLPGYFLQDRSSDCLLYSIGDGTAADRPGAWLFKELVQKLRWNPSLRKEFFELDDGGYWKEHGWELAEGEEIPVDVFRIESIRRLNCLSAPTRSLELLRQPSNSNAELRNGFWCHASYVNHSCTPNSIRTFIGDIHFLRATRDIEAGEEITNQYLAPDIDIDERQEKHRNIWGFQCHCELCVIDSDVSKTTRKERLRHFEELKAMVMKVGERPTTVTAIKKIARGMRELEALYEPSVYATLPRLALVHPSLYLTEAWRSVQNVDRTIEYGLKLLRNFGILTEVQEDSFRIVHNTGFVNVETVRVLKYLAEGYAAKENKTLADKCWEVARKWFVVITGAEAGVEEFLGKS